MPSNALGVDADASETAIASVPAHSGMVFIVS